MTQEFSGRVGFAVGTGRCGTTFLAEVAAQETHVAATHQRHDLSEAFHRYCKWYGLPVDDAGFVATEEAAIRADLETHAYSLESSGYLSLSLRELHARFDARFALLVRRPDKVVSSYVRKGWYAEPYLRGDASLPLGYQPGYKFHHFLGRIAPQGDEFTAWNKMTQVGKLAWYWRTLNEAVLAQFEQLGGAGRIAKIEELDHAAYGDLARFLGFEPKISRARFDALVQKKPNARRGAPPVSTWTTREAQEFETQVAPLAERLGYEYRIDVLRAAEAATTSNLDAAQDSMKSPCTNLVRRWLSKKETAA
ncbi:MAG: hypothetical protein KDA42_02395 [Planctomycetales bacterium]|nr:hypothetical protein [Planctomycetales bacterium]